MRLTGREDRFDSDLDVARGSILEANRAGDAGDELAMHLALGGPAPMAPQLTSDEMYCGEIISRNSVPAGTPMLPRSRSRCRALRKTVIDLKRLVKVGIVDQALPAESRARFLEVDAHHEAELVRVLGNSGFEQLGILARGLGVVDGAGADDDQQALVFALRMLTISLRAL